MVLATKRKLKNPIKWDFLVGLSTGKGKAVVERIFNTYLYYSDLNPIYTVFCFLSIVKSIAKTKNSAKLSETSCEIPTRALWDEFRTLDWVAVVKEFEFFIDRVEELVV